MDAHSADTDQIQRRDKLFCQLALLCNEEGRSDKDGWVLVPEAARKVGCNEGDTKHFLERLIEDGWIEVDDPDRASGIYARLTSVGRARAQIICKGASLAR
jgi:hypothetical protein